MTDIQLKDLERSFRPIYYVEFEETPPGELFPKTFRIGYYSQWAKKEATKVYELSGKRLIEKSMRTGKEKILAER